MRSPAASSSSLDGNPWIAVAFFALMAILALGVVSLRYNINLFEWLEGGLDLGLFSATI